MIHHGSTDCDFARQRETIALDRARAAGHPLTIISMISCAAGGGEGRKGRRAREGRMFLAGNGNKNSAQPEAAAGDAGPSGTAEHCRPELRRQRDFDTRGRARARAEGASMQVKPTKLIATSPCVINPFRLNVARARAHVCVFVSSSSFPLIIITRAKVERDNSLL